MQHQSSPPSTIVTTLPLIFVPFFFSLFFRSISFLPPSSPLPFLTVTLYHRREHSSTINSRLNMLHFNHTSKSLLKRIH
ncbi:hypothetical protein L6452_24032 [Arctium lappa]|uniref:Uncharacterized protein n=1 Tax=Arctium lappa TaxID=4217 RepID=A0ACB9A8N8_ARCLA|nr:hypothetical protein L6452_24032 [Arctium lappa]